MKIQNLRKAPNSDFLIIMKRNALEKDIKSVIRKIETSGLKADVSVGESRVVIGIIGDESKIDFDQLRAMRGVSRALHITVPYKLMSREYIQDDISVKAGRLEIGKNKPIYIAGPCSIESREQIFRIAKQVKEAGADILRGGAFKPRTSVHSFQGLGLSGLQYLYEAGKEFDMPTITEVRSQTDVEIVSKYSDILQIGARNMFNQDLIESVARQGKPVLFKRGPSSQIDEYLSFGERIVAEGNRKIILCERGIIPLGGSFPSKTRNTLDMSAVPILKKETPFPVIVDPSHGTGRRDLIYPMSMAAIASGADGLMIEVHDRPEEALSDGAQAIKPKLLGKLINDSNELYKLLRKLNNK